LVFELGLKCRLALNWADFVSQLLQAQRPSAPQSTFDQKSTAAALRFCFTHKKGSSGTFLAAFCMAHLIFVLDAF